MDIIRFGGGIDPQDIIISHKQTGLQITLKGSKDSIFINNFYLYYRDNYNDKYVINELHFADDSIWNINDLKQRSLSY